MVHEQKENISTTWQRMRNSTMTMTEEGRRLGKPGDADGKPSCGAITTPTLTHLPPYRTFSSVLSVRDTVYA